MKDKRDSGMMLCQMRAARAKSDKLTLDQEHVKLLDVLMIKDHSLHTHTHTHAYRMETLPEGFKKRFADFALSCCMNCSHNKSRKGE